MAHEFMDITIGGRKYRAEMVQLTPELARLWLERNKFNRAIKNRRVAKYARLMKQGNFPWVADPIRFSETGRMLDGQHRVSAVIAADATIDVLVVYGLPDDSQQYMDAGAMRTAPDQIGMELHVPNPSVWSSVASLVIRWDAGDLISNILDVATPEKIAFIRENHDALSRATKAAAHAFATTGTRKSVSGAAYFMAEQVDHDLAARFWREIALGEGLMRGQATFALRDALLRKKTNRWTQIEELAAYVRCWNAARRGNQVQRLQLSRGALTESHFEMK